MSTAFARLRARLCLPNPPARPLREALNRLAGLRPPLPPEAPPTAPSEPSDGAQVLNSMEEFMAFATASDVPGMGQVAEVKFLIEGVRGAPKLWFIHTGRRAYHYDFATEVLGVNLDVAGFNRVTYFTEVRDFIAGSLIHYDHVGGGGVFAIEFWPGDPVGGAVVTLSWQLIRAGLQIPDAALAYHPASGAHEERLEQDRAVIEAAGVQIITTEALYADVRFAPLNPGLGYGVLRVVDGSDGRPPTVRDVVVYATAPNDLPHVAGVITEQPQTPLSHINLKAKQNDTPNAFLADAGKRPEIRGLQGRTVRFEVTADTYDLREATPAEADEHLEAIRPREPQTPVADLGVTDIPALADLRNADTRAFGAKAANLGELIALLPDGAVPQGYALPFAAYHDFMNENGLFEAARAMMAAEDFIADVAVRDARLDAFRKRIKKADVPAIWRDRIGELQQRFGPEGPPIRCRSSTNNEDLEGFNGAGLYDSYTHRPDEGHLSRTIRQVWASLWTLRAFDERTFYRVDHLATCMGVAVHPNFDDERVNGVAITRNVLDPRFEGYYLNNQLGESLVTNPDGALPEEVVIGFIGDDPDAYETIPIRRSSLVGPGERVLSPEHTAILVGYLRVINPHFRQVYGRREEGFAMDLEFKVDAAGRVVIKQARPYVD